MKLKETERSKQLKQMEKDLLVEELQWKREKDLLLRKYSMKKERQALKRSFLPKVNTSKLVLAFMLTNCTILEVFTLYVTLREFDLAFSSGYTPDFTPLVTLISIVVAEVIALVGYFAKSSRENSKGGIVYETAMRSLDTPNEEEQGQG